MMLLNPNPINCFVSEEEIEVIAQIFYNHFSRGRVGQYLEDQHFKQICLGHTDKIAVYFPNLEKVSFEQITKAISECWKSHQIKFIVDIFD